MLLFVVAKVLSQLSEDSGYIDLNNVEIMDNQGTRILNAAPRCTSILCSPMSMYLPPQ